MSALDYDNSGRRSTSDSKVFRFWLQRGCVAHEKNEDEKADSETIRASVKYILSPSQLLQINGPHLSILVTLGYRPQGVKSNDVFRESNISLRGIGTLPESFHLIRGLLFRLKGSRRPSTIGYG